MLEINASTVFFWLLLHLERLQYFCRFTSLPLNPSTVSSTLPSWWILNLNVIWGIKIELSKILYIHNEKIVSVAKLIKIIFLFDYFINIKSIYKNLHSHRIQSSFSFFHDKGSLSKSAILVHSSTNLSRNLLSNFSNNLHKDQMQLLLTTGSLSIFKLTKSCSAANWALRINTSNFWKRTRWHSLTAATSFFNDLLMASKQFGYHN